MIIIFVCFFWFIHQNVSCFSFCVLLSGNYLHTTRQASTYTGREFFFTRKNSLSFLVRIDLAGENQYFNISASTLPKCFCFCLSHNGLVQFSLFCLPILLVLFEYRPLPSYCCQHIFIPSKGAKGSVRGHKLLCMFARIWKVERCGLNISPMI